MARTFGGLLFYSAANINLQTSLTGGATAGNYNLVRNALGDVSLNNNAGAATVQFWLDVADVKRPVPFVPFPAFPGQGTVPLSNEFQELFGTAAGGPGNVIGPGFSGTPAVPWGLAIIDVVAVYSVVTAALTSCTIGLNRATFVENTAFTNTAVLAATGIATTTTTSATTPHVQKVTLAQPLVYEGNDNSNISVELVIQAAATSAVRLYGMGVHVAVEYS
jgi:hypothetical protein